MVKCEQTHTIAIPSALAPEPYIPYSDIQFYILPPSLRFREKKLVVMKCEHTHIISIPSAPVSELGSPGSPHNGLNTNVCYTVQREENKQRKVRINIMYLQ